MRLSELLKTAFLTIKLNKRRTILTMFGIVIGIAAVITILSLGAGYRKQMVDSLTKDSQGRINQSFYFINEETVDDYLSLKPFTEENLETIKTMPGVLDADLGNTEEEEHYLEVKSTQAGLGAPDDMEGEYEDNYVNVKASENVQANLLAGRALTKLDSDRHLRYAMIDSDLASRLFPNEMDFNALIHRTLTVEGQAFTLVGIYESQEVPDPDAMDSPFPEAVTTPPQVYLPQETFTLLNGPVFPDFSLNVYYQEGSNMAQTNRQIKNYLEEAGGENDKGSYDYDDVSEFMTEIGRQLQLITLFITFIASISLFIAGVGVMNMMYISVSERTKEIGIRRAMGASKKSIQLQFLFEGIAITLVGGLLGYLLGIGLAFIISNYLPYNAIIDLPTALVSVIVSTVIGLVFSVFPARTAAKKNVVEILR